MPFEAEGNVSSVIGGDATMSGSACVSNDFSDRRLLTSKFCYFKYLPVFDTGVAYSDIKHIESVIESKLVHVVLFVMNGP